MNRPSPPPEAAKLLEAALDVFVYAPIGFLLDARDVVPKLAERGRGQVTLARMFGRYALQLGQAEAERVLNRQRADAEASEPAPPAEPTEGAAGATMSAATAADEPTTTSFDAVVPEPAAASPGVTPMGPAATPKPAAATAKPRAAARRRSTAGDAAVVAPGAADLPIPGYDTLSASQVVPRLDALLPHELEAVRAYESAHRGRRTILNRIAQRLA